MGGTLKEKVMRTIEDIKKIEFKGIEIGYIDENGNHISDNTFEEIEPVVIDGVEYVHLQYMQGQGLVISNENQRYVIKVLDLNKKASSTDNRVDKSTQKEENKNLEELQEVRFTEIHNNIISSAYLFPDDSVILLHENKYKVCLKEIKELSDTQIESSYGAWAIEDEDTKECFRNEYLYNYIKL